MNTVSLVWMLKVVNSVSAACGDCKAYYKIHWRVTVCKVTMLVKLDTCRCLKRSSGIKKEKNTLNSAKNKNKILKEVLKALPKELCSSDTHTSDFWPDTKTPYSWGNARNAALGRTSLPSASCCPRPSRLWAGHTAAPGHQWPEPAWLNTTTSTLRYK